MRRRTTKKTDRQQRILQELRANTAIRISELAKELGVSGETIRRDLAELGEAGAVNRTYGGAVARPFGAEPNWNERHNLMREERQQMAKVAVGLASPGDVLMLESGSTMLHFAQQLIVTGKDLTVVTPSPNIAIALAQNPSITVILCPGTLNAREGTVLGPETVAFLEQFNANLAFVGSSGITADGLNETLTGMAIVKKAILARARRRVVLLDHTKFDQPSLAVAGALRDINVLVTDQMPQGDLAAALNRAGVQVMLPPAIAPVQAA